MWPTPAALAQYSHASQTLLAYGSFVRPCFAISPSVSVRSSPPSAVALRRTRAFLAAVIANAGAIADGLHASGENRA